MVENIHKTIEFINKSDDNVQNFINSFYQYKNDTDKSFHKPLSFAFSIIAQRFGYSSGPLSTKDDNAHKFNLVSYMFERENTQPTRNRVNQVEEFGIQSVALKPKFAGDFPDLLVKNNSNPSFLMSLRFFCFQLKLASKK